MYRTIAHLITMAAVVAASLLAQVDTGVLSGHVYDNTGAVVPDAQVKLKNLANNYSLVLTTNTAGLYVSPALPTGPYRIDVAHAGFQPQARQLTLNLSERLAVDFSLSVGAVNESVTCRLSALSCRPKIRQSACCGQTVRSGTCPTTGGCSPRSSGTAPASCPRMPNRELSLCRISAAIPAAVSMELHFRTITSSSTGFRTTRITRATA
ncbi:MAG: carboxypeptidase regulatory-like domain-containing protein [Bryobacterales bacterium]|nr:carboxypeptidase regulatory-like domain-containing protein [Bryobacterales bacterium]